MSKYEKRPTNVEEPATPVAPAPTDPAAHEVKAADGTCVALEGDLLTRFRARVAGRAIGSCAELVDRFVFVTAADAQKIELFK